MSFHPRFSPTYGNNTPRLHLSQKTNPQQLTDSLHAHAALSNNTEKSSSSRKHSPSVFQLAQQFGKQIKHASTPRTNTPEPTNNQTKQNSFDNSHVNTINTTETKTKLSEQQQQNKETSFTSEILFDNTINILKSPFTDTQNLETTQPTNDINKPNNTSLIEPEKQTETQTEKIITNNSHINEPDQQIENQTKITTEQQLKIKQIIIDNIKTKLTDDQLLNHTKQSLLGYASNVQHMKRGGLSITPTNNGHALNKLLKKETYPTDIYGHDIYIHFSRDKTDLRSWLCVNKIPYNQQTEDETLQKIKTELTNIINVHTDTRVIIEGLHRKTSGQTPSSLILFKTEDMISQKTLTNTTITIDGKQHNIRLYINKSYIQCTNCYKIGHSKKQCTNKRACVRCNKDCPVGSCKNGSLRKCANCNGAHASTFKNCTAIKHAQQSNFDSERNKNKNKQYEDRQHDINVNLKNITNKQTLDTHNIKNNTDEINQLKQTNIELEQQITNLRKQLEKHIKKYEKQKAHYDKWFINVLKRLEAIENNTDVEESDEEKSDSDETKE